MCCSGIHSTVNRSRGGVARGRSVFRLLATGAVLASLGMVTRASAQLLVIQPGLDHLQTVQPTDISFGLDQIPPIPPGFLGPGCDPFIGTIQLEGAPIDPPTLHTIDTIVRRPMPVVLNPPPSTGMIPIELIEMRLQSIEPIVVQCGTGMQSFDVRVSLDPDSLSTGSMQVLRQTLNSGVVMDSFFDVFVRVEFQPVGGGPSLVLPSPPSIHIQATGPYNWRTTPYRSAYPGSGPNFYIGTGPYTLRNDNDATHTVEPPPPPPDYHETWRTPPLEETWVELGTTPGGYPALPTGFFDPGSDPFIGRIDLRGVPLDLSNLGYTDTIVQRSADPVQPTDPPGALGTVPIEIMALSLRSANPIVVTYGGGAPESWNVRVALSDVTPPPGSLTAQKTHPNGGTYNMTLPVLPKLIFTRGDGAVRELDAGLSGLATLQFTQTGGHFVHLLDPGISSMFHFHASARWNSGVREVLPGNPASQIVDAPTLPAPQGPAQHRVCPPKKPPPPPDYHVTWVPDDLSVDDTWVDLGTTPGGYPPIPPGFFNPGSLPFEGRIILRGLPIDVDNLGETDTIVQRTANPVQPSDPPGAGGTVPIEIVQLSLVSASPITVNYDPNGPQPEIWDVRVTLSDVTPPPGSLTAQKTHANGGTYDMTLPVLPKLIFTRHGDGATRVFDAGLFDLPPLEFTQTGGNFVHALDPNLASMIHAHPQATWVAGVQETVPGDPTSQVTESPILPAPQGPAQHRVCPPKKNPLVCIYRVSCADGSCDQCPLCTNDICQGSRCPNLTCASGFSASCGPDCCLHYQMIDCRRPAGEPFCPINLPCPCDPTPGACCLPNGTCTVVPECECDGLYLGDNTTCGPVTGCCFGDGTCTDMPVNCCLAYGGTPTADLCDPPQGCCLPDGSCQDMDPECCQLLGGIPKPGLCAPPVACCLGPQCIMTDPECCLLRGGTLDPSGVCEPPQKCCVGGTCLNMDPDCCQLLGGVPGPGLCAVQKCCQGLGCVNNDPFCCQINGGNPGPGLCGPNVECCLGGGNCVETDFTCCLQVGGTPFPDNCDPVEVCCLPLPGGGCQAGVEPDCCVVDLNGQPDGPGACIPPQACCLANGDCIDEDPLCCQNAHGGVPRGPGTACTAPRACCINGACSMLDPQCCLAQGGTPQAPGSSCSPLPQACCFPNGMCLNRDPLCCDDLGGTVTPGLCQGDVNPPNGIDDACEGGGGGNPPGPAPAGPDSCRKNKYISFAPSNGGQMVAYRVQKHALPGGPGDGVCVGTTGSTGVACTGAAAVGAPMQNQGTCPAMQLCIRPYTTSPAGSCWVQAPVAVGPPQVPLQWWSKCDATPVFRDWSNELVINVGDCEIIPAMTYTVYTNVPGPIENPNGLDVGTILLPNKYWGDVVGASVVGGLWPCPQGVVNAADVSAVASIPNNVGTKPPFTYASLVGAGVGPCLNTFVNAADVSAVVLGAQGKTYSSPDTPSQPADPALCLPCP